MVEWGRGPAERRGVTARAPAHLGHVEGLVLVVQVPVRLVRHCAERSVTK
jgi:hypothetical protein